LKRISLSALSLAVVLAATPAVRAEEACKTVAMKNPAPTLAEMYTMAEKLAKAWKSDAAPARITNTTLGPLQPNGSSAAWNLLFYSPSADSRVAISTFRGSLTCWADKGGAGRMPDFKPDFFRDGAALYAIAKANAGPTLAEGYTVMLGTAAAPKDRHATWNINFSKDQAKDAPLTILVNANTGKVEDVVKH
jgi:hypothetical protein